MGEHLSVVAECHVGPFTHWTDVQGTLPVATSWYTTNRKAFRLHVARGGEGGGPNANTIHTRTETEL